MGDNIYQVVDTKTDTVIAKGYANREYAKIKRDQLNGEKPVDGARLRHVVSRGSNHPLGETNGVDYSNKRVWA